jgi:hypothetical protein
VEDTNYRQEGIIDTRAQTGFYMAQDMENVGLVTR